MFSKKMEMFKNARMDKKVFVFYCIIFLFISLTERSSAQMTFINHPQPPGYTVSQTRERHDMKCDVSNNIWMGFRYIGLGKYNGSSWVMYDSLNNGLPCNEIFSIDVSDPADIWLGTRLGASRFNGFTFTNYDSLNSGLPVNKINVVIKNGPLVWFGTNAGLIQYNGTNWNVYNTANSGLLNDTISALCVSGNAIWIGTNAGISKFENNIFSNYNSSNSIIPDSKVYDIETDNYGNVWISSVSVYMIQPSGTVLSVINEVYTDELPMLTSGKADIAKDSNGRIIVRVIFGSLHIIRFDNFNYEIFELPPFYTNSTFNGFKMLIDATNNLWITSRLDFSTVGAFYSFDVNSYQPSIPTQFELNFDNYKQLEINKVKALMLNRGDMHWDLNNPKYEVPKGSGKHSVYTSALWIGGLDQGGNIHLAAQTYRQSGNDFWPGPIAGISIPFDSSSCYHYDKIWKVSKWQVEEFKNKFADGSVAIGSYIVSPTFLTWPAKGNNFVTDDKAPFVDFNNDNSYNPFDGDYPLIKGDQMLFWMFNDSLAVHESSNGSKLGLEVHVSAYAYNCTGINDSNAVLNTTTLYNYRIINCSNNNYNGMYIGLWCDNDLGNASDDYVGCDTTLAAGFAWNGDNDDEYANGYGLNPPMQNIVILKGTPADPGDGKDNDLDGVVDEAGERTTMNHFMYYNGTNNSPTGNPWTYTGFYTYLQSLWLDNQPLTYGGDGRDLSNPPTNFMFSGTPYGSGWTEFSAGNPPEDRRFVMSSGPVSMPVGGELNLDFAYVFTHDSLNPNGLTTSVARNIADVQRVRSWFDNDNFPSCEIYTVGVGEIENGKWEIFPNPANDFINISHSFYEKTNLKFSVTDVSGRILRSSKLSDSAIDISEFSSGFYLLIISNGTENFAKSFVKY